MTEIDRAALALYCQAWARWVEAEAALTRYGVVITSPHKFLMPSPYLAIANKAIEQMAKLLVEFGMSPSSRSRVSPPALVRAERSPRSLLQPVTDPRAVLRAVK